MARIRGFELVKEEARQNHVKCILLPKRSTKHSAGYDFFLPKNVAILPHSTTLFMVQTFQQSTLQQFMLQI